MQNFNDRFGLEMKTVDDAMKYLSNNYTIYIVSFNAINLLNGTVTGSRIGLCAPEINLTHSHLDAASLGCSPGHGLGHGIGNDLCPGAGGAHGGKGGIGSIGHNRQECEELIPDSYFSEGEAKYEGSAGGKGNMTMGGSGGGIVWMASTGTITLNSSCVNVTGGNGNPGNKGHLGSGGGAGGSV